MLKETNDGIIATIRISPNAKKNEIIRDGEFTKIKITGIYTLWGTLSGRAQILPQNTFSPSICHK